MENHISYAIVSTFMGFVSYEFDHLISDDADNVVMRHDPPVTDSPSTMNVTWTSILFMTKTVFGTCASDQTMGVGYWRVSVW
jgi:hypothetical protein